MSAGKYTFFRWTPGDFTNSDAFYDLSLLEKGLLFNLLMEYWESGGELQMDAARLARRCSCEAHQVTASMEKLGHWFRIKDGKLKCRFLDAEFKRCTELSKEKSKAGKQGGRGKKKETGKPDEGEEDKSTSFLGGKADEKHELSDGKAGVKLKKDERDEKDKRDRFEVDTKGHESGRASPGQPSDIEDKHQGNFKSRNGRVRRKTMDKPLDTFEAEAQIMALQGKLSRLQVKVTDDDLKTLHKYIPIAYPADVTNAFEALETKTISRENIRNPMGYFTECLLYA